MTDAGTKKLAAYKASLATEPPAAIESLRSEVAEFARQFPTVGYAEEDMRYP